MDSIQINYNINNIVEKIRELDLTPDNVVGAVSYTHLTLPTNREV